MASKNIDFYFDIGSPNAYFAWRVLPEIAERTGASVRPLPVLIGGIFKATNNQPPIIAFGEVKGKIAYEQTEIRRFIARHGLSEFRFNPHFPVNSLMLMRGAVIAEEEGALDAYMAAGFRTLWEEERKMDDPEEFVRGLTEHGLDGAHFLKRTQDQAVKDRLAEATKEAVERGVFGLPTFFAGNEMFFGKNTLRDLEEEITRQAD